MITKKNVIEIANVLFNFLKDTSVLRLSICYLDLQTKVIDKNEKPERIQMGNYTISYTYKEVEGCQEIFECEVIVTNKKNDLLHQLKRYKDRSVLINII